MANWTIPPQSLHAIRRALACQVPVRQRKVRLRPLQSLEDVAAVFKGMRSGRLTKMQSAADWLYDRRVVHANNSLARASVRIGGWPMVVARGADISAGLF